MKRTLYTTLFLGVLFFPLIMLCVESHQVRALSPISQSIISLVYEKYDLGYKASQLTFATSDKEQSLPMGAEILSGINGEKTIVLSPEFNQFIEKSVKAPEEITVTIRATVAYKLLSILDQSRRDVSTLSPEELEKLNLRATKFALSKMFKNELTAFIEILKKATDCYNGVLPLACEELANRSK